MEYTNKKGDELKAFGYKELGIYTTGSKEIADLIKNRNIYNSILLKKVDNNGSIISVYAK